MSRCARRAPVKRPGRLLDSQCPHHARLLVAWLGAVERVGPCPARGEVCTGALAAVGLKVDLLAVEAIDDPVVDQRTGVVEGQMNRRATLDGDGGRVELERIERPDGDIL